MLDAMRRGVANLFAKVLLGLLVVAFALWGIGDYLGRGPSQSGPMATVGKTQISVDDFRHAYQQEIEVRRRASSAAQLTPEQAKLLGVPEARASTRLIGDAPRSTCTPRSSGSRPPTPSSARSSGASIRTIIDAKGRIDGNKYRQVIRQAGFRSVGEYERARRRDLWREQLTETLGANPVPQKYLLEVLYRFRDEQRAIEYIIPDFTKRITVADPSEKQQQEFYESNKGKYVAFEERQGQSASHVARGDTVARQGDRRGDQGSLRSRKGFL